MRWLIALATVIALSLASALAVRTFKPAKVEASVSVGCPDTTLRPPPLMPESAAAPLQLVVDPSVALFIDGAEAGPSLLEGEHTLLATAPGQKPAKLKLHVDAFTPVLLEVRASSGAVTVLMVGGRCTSCAAAVTDLDLKYRPGTLGDSSGVAKALAEGDWLEAGHMVRGIAPSEREAPEPTRLLAVLYAFVGRPTLVREQVAALDDQALRDALTRRDALEELKPVRQLQTATARWNATTERFQRVTDRFVAEAPRPLTALTRTFGELSKRFGGAQEAQDAIGCEAALEAANSAVGESIAKLRAMRPGDCGWQRRVTETF